MKVMVLVKASKASEAGEMPGEALLSEMMQFNEELSKAGVLLAGDGLQPSSKGVRVHFSGKDRVVTDGPFAETKELIAGYWLWQVASLQEAIDWVKRCPNPHPEGGIIEIRPVFEPEDFGEALTPKLGAQWERLQAEAEARTKTDARRQVNHGLSPHLVIDGAVEAIDFYKRAFGAEEMIRVPGENGRLMHAAVSINGAMVMLVDEMPECGALSPKSLNGSPVTVHLMVDDVDAFIARAEQAGAEVIMPAADMFWGDRYGIIKDPFGHHWSIATHLRDMSEDELKDAAKQAQCGATQ